MAEQCFRACAGAFLSISYRKLDVFNELVNVLVRNNKWEVDEELCSGLCLNSSTELLNMSDWMKEIPTKYHICIVPSPHQFIEILQCNDL